MMMIIPSVKRIRSRSSGIRQVFANAEIMGKRKNERALYKHDEEAHKRFLAGKRQRMSGGSGGNLDGATSLLDLLTGGSTDRVDGDRELLRKITVAEDLHLVETTVDETGRAKDSDVDDGAIVEVHLKIGEVNHRHNVAEFVVVEALLGQTTMDRHLATFEARTDGSTGASVLALVAF